MADSFSAHGPVVGYKQVLFHGVQNLGNMLGEHLDLWHSQQEVRSGTVVLNDFNFEMPKVDLRVRRSAPNEHDKADSQIYDQPGNYLQGSEGQNYARLRLEEEDVPHDHRTGGGNVRGIGTGSIFTLSPLEKFPGAKIVDAAEASPSDPSEQDYLSDEEYREYLVTSSNFDVHGPHYESQDDARDEEIFRCTLTAIDSHRPYRMQRLPPPLVHGPQTATVVGEAGEEIWTDKYGRVKVQFHWDRDGKKDENSSCWVRVAQVWAGAQWGAMHIPRVGQEVIVDFLEGDPDKPIVIGRVYNADNMPPYTLPDNKTQSGIKSRSTKGGNPQNFNEIRFEDLKGHEELHIQAEKDMSTLVKHDQSTSVGGDRSISVTGNQSVTISGKGESPVHSTVSVTGKHTLDASDTIKIQAPTSITLECGGSTIVMEPGKITITAGGGAKFVLDANALAQSNAGAKTLHDANVLHQSVVGSKVLLDANVLAQSSGGSKVVLDGSALVDGVGGATVHGGPNATLTSGASTVKTSGSGVDVSGPKVDIAGSGTVKISGAVVKVN